MPRSAKSLNEIRDDVEGDFRDEREIHEVPLVHVLYVCNFGGKAVQEPEE